MMRRQKVRNVERDERVALSIEGQAVNQLGLREYPVVHGRARTGRRTLRVCCRSWRTSTWGQTSYSHPRASTPQDTCCGSRPNASAASDPGQTANAEQTRAPDTGSRPEDSRTTTRGSQATVLPQSELRRQCSHIRAERARSSLRCNALAWPHTEAPSPPASLYAKGVERDPIRVALSAAPVHADPMRITGVGVSRS
jgi:hypothetical protein